MMKPHLVFKCLQKGRNLVRSLKEREGVVGLMRAALRRSAMVNGLTGLCITKLDILDGIETLKICVGYKNGNDQIDLLPLGADQTENCEPILIDMPGWSENTFGTKRLG